MDFAQRLSDFYILLDFCNYSFNFDTQSAVCSFCTLLALDYTCCFILFDILYYLTSCERSQNLSFCDIHRAGKVLFFLLEKVIEYQHVSEGFDQYNLKTNLKVAARGERKIHLELWEYKVFNFC